MIKIIFLDIDGVLNHELFYKANRHVTEDVPYPASNIDPVSIKKLNRLIRRTGAKIVITSTWRLGRTIMELQDILESRGFEGEIIDKTDSLDFKINWTCRGNEIFKWILDNERIVGNRFDYNNYLILDDDTDMLFQQTKNFIPINSFYGITNEVINKGIEVLNTEYTKKIYEL